MQYRKGQFIRKDVGSVSEGRGVIYECHGFPFMILATRKGVGIQGELPIMPGVGAESVMRMIWRAIQQHKALNTPIGEKQEPCNEEELMAREKDFFTAWHAHDDSTVAGPRRSVILAPGPMGGNPS